MFKPIASILLRRRRGPREWRIKMIRHSCKSILHGYRGRNRESITDTRDEWSNTRGFVFPGKSRALASDFRETQSPECCFIRHGLSVVDFISSTSVKFIFLLHKKPLFSTNFDTGKLVVMRNYVNCNCDVIHKLYRWPLWRHRFIIWYVRNMQELLSLVETKAHRPIINKLVQNFWEWQNIFIRHGWSCSSTAIVEENTIILYMLYS